MNNLQDALTHANTTVQTFKDRLVVFGIDYGSKIVGALIILIIGFMISRWLGHALKNWLDKQQMEPPIKTLMIRVVRLVIMVFTVLAAADKAGLPITTAIAGLSVAGIGMGLALQGVLSNLVAGLSIIFAKPFRVGEYIEIAGVQGQVSHIELFTTILTHADQSKVIVPNRKIVGEILHNFGTKRQLDLTVGVAYGTDINEVLALIKQILAENPRVIATPPPAFGVTTLGDSAISISIKPWTKLEDFGGTQVELYQTILNRFKAAKIEIPYPQRFVHMINPAVAA